MLLERLVKANYIPKYAVAMALMQKAPATWYVLANPPKEKMSIDY